jgi:nucleoporin NUP82
LQLQREYDRLLPSLKELQQKDIERQKKLNGSDQTFGISQAFELGQRSNEE